MNIAPSPVIERVKKLLALAASGNPHERDVALAKAHARIAEHRIDLVLLESKENQKAEGFGEQELVYGGRLPVEAKFIA